MRSRSPSGDQPGECLRRLILVAAGRRQVEGDRERLAGSDRLVALEPDPAEDAVERRHDDGPAFGRVDSCEGVVARAKASVLRPAMTSTSAVRVSVARTSPGRLWPTWVTRASFSRAERRVDVAATSDGLAEFAPPLGDVGLRAGCAPHPDRFAQQALGRLAVALIRRISAMLYFATDSWLRSPIASNRTRARS